MIVSRFRELVVRPTLLHLNPLIPTRFVTAAGIALP
jgi:hypothetical protein